LTPDEGGDRLGDRVRLLDLRVVPQIGQLAPIEIDVVLLERASTGSGRVCGDGALTCRLWRRRRLDELRARWLRCGDELAGHDGAGYAAGEAPRTSSDPIANLWPEIAPGYHEKDKVENALHDAVCSGRIPVRVAQLAIARDWRRAGVVVPGAGPAPPPMPAPAPAGAGSPTGGEGPGSTTHSGDAAFCSTHACIANFPNGKGAVVRCADGEWSHSGGLTGVCNRHGGSR
jgi:hypothetical protein